MENTIKTAISYCKNQASYSYLKDTITTFIENKKEIKNQTQTIEMICGDLFNIQCLFNNGKFNEGIKERKQVKAYILSFNN